ncbi:hypothetical protein C4568_04580 [Candidatus Parcubacteria bacterium]|nr:MAG: hypothetical protein C4568_04580 [Candidatus Parcubacteria bacterium]
MNAFKEQCIELRKKDFTLNEIVKITGRSKTSIHFHIRDLPLSRAKQLKIKAAKRRFAIKLAADRRGKSARLHKKFSDWGTESVCLVSHLLFDGELKRSGCVYNNRNISLLNRVEQCMKVIYDREPKRYLNKLTGVSRISYHNVSLAEYLKERSEHLLREIPGLDKDLQREFIRSFFDDEGCMDFRPQRNLRQIRGYQKKPTILFLVQKLLLNFELPSRISGNEIIISGKENLIKFKKEINFSPGIRINGNRSNSIWKQSLEKRVLLARAIASYQK